MKIGVMPIMNDREAIKSAESIVSSIQFWKKPDALTKRMVRQSIRKNYKTSKLLFNGFFGVIRETSRTDYIDEASMVLSKTIEFPDKDIIEKAIKALGKYGFVVSVYWTAREGFPNACRVVMSPNKIYSDFYTEYYLTKGKLDANEYLNKIRLFFE